MSAHSHGLSTLSKSTFYDLSINFNTFIFNILLMLILVRMSHLVPHPPGLLKDNLSHVVNMPVHIGQTRERDYEKD